jgi:ribosomal protein S18 acetylase RimI-like enzyme
VTQIRRAARSDLSEIARLHRDASEFRRDLDPRSGPGQGDSKRFGKDLRSMLRRPEYRIMVAEEGAAGGLDGYAVGTVVHNEPFSISRYGYIGCLHVGEDRRGQGTEDALLEAIRSWFKEEALAAAQIDVSRRAVGMQHFWERRGFRAFLDHLLMDVGQEFDDSVGLNCMIRKAEAADTDSVILLWKEMMDAHSAIDERLSVASTWREMVASSIRRWLGDRDSRLIVAQTADGVIGFALGGVVHPTLGLESNVHGQIAHLCVGARWRRSGVGRQLVASLRDWLADRRVPSIHLYVSRYNPISQHFWRSLGFEDYVSRLWCDLV